MGEQGGRPRADRERGSGWLGRGAIVFAAAVLIYLILHSPFFGVQAVEVIGHRLMDEAEVIGLAGVKLGDNLLRLDTRGIRRRLEEDPRIGAAQVQRVLPSRLRIIVDERRPVAMVPYADGFLFVDEQGRLLAADRRSRPALPVVTGIPLERVGRHLAPPDELVVAAWAASLLPDSLAPRVAEIHVDENGELLLFTLEGVPVRLGEPIDLRTKLQVLQSLLDELRGQSFSSIDLRVPEAPAVRR